MAFNCLLGVLIISNVYILNSTSVDQQILNCGPILLAGTSLGLALVSLKSRQVIAALPFGGILTPSQNKDLFGGVLSQLIVGNPLDDLSSFWLSGETALVLKIIISIILQSLTFVLNGVCAYRKMPTGFIKS